jgi:hypothetical protein
MSFMIPVMVAVLKWYVNMGSVGSLGWIECSGFWGMGSDCVMGFMAKGGGSSMVGAVWCEGWQVWSKTCKLFSGFVLWDFQS